MHKILSNIVIIISYNTRIVNIFFKKRSAILHKDYVKDCAYFPQTVPCGTEFLCKSKAESQNSPPETEYYLLARNRFNVSVPPVAV